jgi:outer membrane protein
MFLLTAAPAWSEPIQPHDPTASPDEPSAQRPIKIPGSLLGLEEAIRIGLAQHPLLEQSRYSSKVAKAITKQTKGALYPWLEASVAGSSGSMRIVTSDGRTIHDRGGHGFDPGGALPKHNQNMLTGGLLLNQLITDFGYTTHMVLANQAHEAASEKEILTNKAFVILTVQRTYLNCLMQQRLVEIAQETLNRRKAIRDQIETMYRHQLKSKLDLDLILVEVSNAELTLIRAKNDLRQRFAALNNAMGIEGPENYGLEKVSLALAPAPEVSALVTESLQNRPELLGGRDRVRASEELLKAVRALHFGSLSAVGTIGITKYGDVHDSGIPADGVAPLWGVGATARLPIFTGFRIQNQIVEAHHRNKGTEQELQNLANEVILQVVRAYLALTTNADQIALEQERVAFSREALTLAQERYKLGLSPIVEVIQATTALFEAESRLAESQYIYKTSEAAVAYAIGRDYKRFGHLQS